MNQDDKVIAILLNYNQNDYTIKCVESLQGSTYKNLFIIAIDNGSTEENFLFLQSEINKYSRVIIKRLVENRGYVGGINYGFEEGRKFDPDYFLIMNNDTIIDKNSICELVKTSKEFNNNVIVSGKIYSYDEPDRLQFIGFKETNRRMLIFNKIGKDEIDNGQYDKIMEMDCLDDVFWLLPAKLYLQIGGYSPYFWFNYEQEDFALRAKNAGYRLIYAPKAKIWHKGSASVGGRDYNPNLAYWTIQSSLILKYMHLPKIHFSIFYTLTIYSIVRTFIKSVYFKISGKQDIFKYAKAKYLGWMYFNKWIMVKNVNTGFNPLDR